MSVAMAVTFVIDKRVSMAVAGALMVAVGRGMLMIVVMVAVRMGMRMVVSWLRRRFDMAASTMRRRQRRQQERGEDQRPRDRIHQISRGRIQPATAMRVDKRAGPD